ncbi:hypothetical protein K439DRAFT_1618118 [Ramaria rubella]|nr:hypothetical protein K439DRAFT_1618118 [Ramaria rubella]
MSMHFLSASSAKERPYHPQDGTLFTLTAGRTLHSVRRSPPGPVPVLTKPPPDLSQTPVPSHLRDHTFHSRALLPPVGPHDQRLPPEPASTLTHPTPSWGLCRVSEVRGTTQEVIQPGSPRPADGELSRENRLGRPVAIAKGGRGGVSAVGRQAASGRSRSSPSIRQPRVYAYPTSADSTFKRSPPVTYSDPGNRVHGGPLTSTGSVCARQTVTTAPCKHTWFCVWRHPPTSRATGFSVEREFHPPVSSTSIFCHQSPSTYRENLRRTSNYRATYKTGPYRRPSGNRLTRSSKSPVPEGYRLVGERSRSASSSQGPPGLGRTPYLPTPWVVLSGSTVVSRGKRVQREREPNPLEAGVSCSGLLIVQRSSGRITEAFSTQGGLRRESARCPGLANLHVLKLDFFHSSHSLPPPLFRVLVSASTTTWERNPGQPVPDRSGGPLGSVHYLPVALPLSSPRCLTRLYALSPEVVTESTTRRTELTVYGGRRYTAVHVPERRC